MTKRQAMIEALAILSGEAEAMSSNNLGMEAGPERKVQAALKRLADELQKRCHRMSANDKAHFSEVSDSERRIK